MINSRNLIYTNILDLTNFTELGRELGCDPRTAKKYYYLKEDGYENKRKRRKSKLDPYRNIIDEKVKNSCSATSIFYFIKEMGYTVFCK